MNTQIILVVKCLILHNKNIQAILSIVINASSKEIILILLAGILITSALDLTAEILLRQST